MTTFCLTISPKRNTPPPPAPPNFCCCCYDVEKTHKNTKKSTTKHNYKNTKTQSSNNHLSCNPHQKTNKQTKQTETNTKHYTKQQPQFGLQTIPFHMRTEATLNIVKIYIKCRFASNVNIFHIPQLFWWNKFYCFTQHWRIAGECSQPVITWGISFCNEQRMINKHSEQWKTDFSTTWNNPPPPPHIHTHTHTHTPAVSDDCVRFS